MPPILIDADALSARLDPLFLVESLRAGHAGGARPEVRRSLIAPTAGEDCCLVWSGWLPDDVVAIKAATVFPGNAAGSRLPNIHSLVQVFDARDGRPLAVIHGEAFTRMKTAADSALGIGILARRDAETLTVIGAGGQAETHVRFILAVRPTIRRIHICNRDRARAAALCARLGDLGVDVDTADDVETAVRNADVLTCLTASPTPVFKGQWLRPGAHVDLVGGYTPEMRESDDAAVLRARLFADSRQFTVDICGDFSDPIARSIIAPADIEADLFSLCSGIASKDLADDDIRLFKNGGGGHLDAMTASALVLFAQSSSHGRP